MKGLYLINGLFPECNIYVIDGEIVIDSGTGQNFSQVKEMLEKFSMSPHTLVNTHYHYDHTGGNKKFRDWAKCAIACHKEDEGYITSGNNLADLFNKQAQSCSVDFLTEDGDKVDTENYSFNVIHTPGHTQGSICLYEKSKKILISGDTLFDNNMGRTDLSGGNHEDMRKTMEKLVKLPVEILLSGHGQPRYGGIQLMVKQFLATRF